MYTCSIYVVKAPFPYTDYCTLQVYIAGTNFSSNIFLKLAHAVYGYNLMTQQSNILAAYQSDKSLSITDSRDPPKKEEGQEA